MAVMATVTVRGCWTVVDIFGFVIVQIVRIYFSWVLLLLLV
jgi:hypothetical protein